VGRVLEDPRLRAGAQSVAEEMARMPGRAEVVEQLTRIT